jgi:Methyltransferase domain
VLARRIRMRDNRAPLEKSAEPFEERRGLPMLKNSIPYKGARWIYRRLRRMWQTRSNAAIFDRIYTERHWGIGSDPDVPFYSGIGSYDPSTEAYVGAVASVIKTLNVGSVIEVGCGDFAVAARYVDLCKSYVGVDVVKRLVDYNNEKFGRPNVRFRFQDAAMTRLEPADLCIIRQVLQHLSNNDIAKLIRNIQSPHVLITEHLPSAAKTIAYNLDKGSGADIRVPKGSGVFIDKPPFNLNAKIILEHNVTSEIHEPDERFVTWLVTNDRQSKPAEPE